MSEQNKPATIGNFLNFPNTQKFLEANLGEKRSEFVSNLLAMCESSADLAACDPKQLMMCAMNATSLNLPLNKNLGYAYIIPYKGVPSFQIGYKGLIQLAIRTGAYEFLNACDIKEGEIERNKITGEIKFIGEKPDGKVIGYLAYLKLKSGFQASLFMSVEDVDKHALKYSKSYAYDKNNGKRTSKWSDPNARPKMALKTVLKGLLSTYGVMTTEMNAAISADNDNEVGSNNYQDAEIVPQPEDDTKTVQI